MDRLGELSSVGEIGGLGLHPKNVGKRCRGQRFGDRIRYAAADLVVALRGLGQLAVPWRIGAQLLGLCPGGMQRCTRGERPPLLGSHANGFALALTEFEHVRHGLSVGHQARVVLPGRHEPRLDLVENAVDRLLAVLPPRVDRVGDQAENALALKPTAGRRVLAVAKRIEKMTIELLDAQFVKRRTIARKQDL